MGFNKKKSEVGLRRKKNQQNKTKYESKVKRKGGIGMVGGAKGSWEKQSHGDFCRWGTNPIKGMETAGKRGGVLNRKRGKLKISSDFTESRVWGGGTRGEESKF